MSFLRRLLFPASLLYKGIMAARNGLYDRNLLRSTQFKVPVLVVGNLTVGGTGKTPHVEYLLKLLKDKTKVAVLSRGYKRKTKGFRLAGPSDTPATLGDEPMLYYRQFPDVQVAVGEDRPAAIEKLLSQKNRPQVLVLNDAFQHRPLQASFYLLLTDYGRLFYRDEVLPAGLLRESKAGAERAHAVVVTKCKAGITDVERAEIARNINRYTKPGTPVFFTTYAYGEPVAIGHAQALARKVLMLTGIANPAPLRDYLLQQQFSLASELTFPDHFAYSAKEVELLRQELKKHAPGTVSVITTSKDAVKLQSPELQGLLAGVPLFYVPVQVAFTDGRQAEFNRMLLAAAGITAANT